MSQVMLVDAGMHQLTNSSAQKQTAGDGNSMKRPIFMGAGGEGEGEEPK